VKTKREITEEWLRFLQRLERRFKALVNVGAVFTVQWTIGGLLAACLALTVAGLCQIVITEREFTAVLKLLETAPDDFQARRVKLVKRGYIAVLPADIDPDRGALAVSEDVEFVWHETDAWN
jgi:hypothetical protein